MRGDGAGGDAKKEDGEDVGGGRRVEGVAVVWWRWWTR